MSRSDPEDALLEEVPVDDDDIDENFEIEEVSDASSDEDELSDDLQAVLRSIKAGKSKPEREYEQREPEPLALPRIPSASGQPRRDSEKKVGVSRRPIVVDDFIRNFFVKLGLTKSLESFQTEWHELKQTGRLNEEDVELVPDLYARNEALDAQIKQLREEINRSKDIASEARGTWDQFRKERDFHRMHHRRVQQENKMLLKDIKRLKDKYVCYEPALEKLKDKFENAVKDKTLIRMERDRYKAKAEALEAQLRSFQAMHKAPGQQDATPSSTTTRTAAAPLPVPVPAPVSVPGKKMDKTSQDLASKDEKKSSKKRVADTAFPQDDRPNPHLQQQFEATPAAKWSMRKSFKAHPHSVAGLALHPKKPVLATCSDDKTWKLWSVPKGDLIMSGDGHKDWVANCAFHPRDALLATASGDSTVKVWDLAHAKCSATFTDHTHAVWDVAYHDTGDFLASCSLDHTARLWDLATGRCRQTFRGHVDSVNSVQFQPFSNILTTASGDKTLSLWDMRTGLCVQTFYGHANAVLHASFNLRGDTVISSDADGVVKLWDVRTVSERLEIVTVTTERHPAHAAKFDRSGKVIAVASDAGVVKIYSGMDGQHLADLEGHEGAVQNVLWDPNGQYLVSAGSDCTVRFWS